MSSRVTQTEEIQSQTGVILAVEENRFAISPSLTLDDLEGNELPTKDMMLAVTPSQSYSGAWEVSAYDAGSIVDHEGTLWRANADTLTTDVPGSSVKWDDILVDVKSVLVADDTLLDGDAETGWYYAISYADYSRYGDYPDVRIYRDSLTRIWLDYQNIVSGEIQLPFPDVSEDGHTLFAYLIIITK